jgi:hypothetical protein
MLQQKQGDAQILCRSFNAKMELWPASYTKLTIPNKL